VRKSGGVMAAWGIVLIALGVVGGEGVWAAQKPVPPAGGLAVFAVQGVAPLAPSSGYASCYNRDTGERRRFEVFADPGVGDLVVWDCGVELPRYGVGPGDRVVATYEGHYAAVAGPPGPLQGPQVGPDSLVMARLGGKALRGFCSDLTRYTHVVIPMVSDLEFAGAPLWPFPMPASGVICDGAASLGDHVALGLEVIADGAVPGPAGPPPSPVPMPAPGPTSPPGPRGAP